jgi:large subunit ribosomal protein L25
MSSTTTTLSASLRSARGKGPARQIRMTGGVPAEVYGLGEPNQSVVVDAHALGLILAKGQNELIGLSVEGAKEQLALCRQVVRHPVRGTLTHVDFIRVRADQEISAEVPLSFLGEAEGVSAGGLLEQLVFAISITARPSAIPQSIEYDVSAMTLGDQVRAGDLTVPAGVTIQNDPDELLAMVSIPRALAAQTDEGEEGEAGEGGEPRADAGEAAAADSGSGDAEE